MPRPCQHCNNASCVKACPVGARYKREDGITATDSDRCIGCRYCEVACPYGVNCFNWKDPKDSYYLDWNDKDLPKNIQKENVPYANPDLQKLCGKEQRKIAGGGQCKGVMEKCTFCVHRLEKGLDPACAQTCPLKAIYFGDLEDPNSEVSQLLRTRSSFRLLEETGTDPNVYYLGGRHPSNKTHQIEEINPRIKS